MYKRAQSSHRLDISEALEISSEIYSEDRQEVDLKENVVKRAETASLLECTGIWFAGGKFGLSWKALQVRVKSAGGLSGYSFVDESDDEGDDDLEDDVEDGSGDALDNQVADSSSEDDSDDDEEEEPVVVKVTKKRGRKKKNN